MDFPPINNTEPPPRLGAPAPEGFKPIVGGVTHVKLAINFELREGRRKVRADSLAKIAGLRYEDKVQAELVSRVIDYIPSPVMHFRDDNGYRRVIPDGLLSRPQRVWAFEIKAQHCPEAWWQLEKLYRPVLEARRMGCPVTCVEICRSFDPAMPYPCEFETHNTLESVLASRAPYVVWPWRL